MRKKKYDMITITCLIAIAIMVVMFYFVIAYPQRVILTRTKTVTLQQPTTITNNLTNNITNHVYEQGISQNVLDYVNEQILEV